MLRSTSIGAIGDEHPGDKRSRVEDDDDSSGGDTDVMLSIEERVGSMLTEAKAALRDAEAQPTERLRELQARLSDLASRATTPPVLRQQLTRAQLRLQRVEVARDAEATQVDDHGEVYMETESESGGDSGSSGPPPQEDSYAVRSQQPGDEEVLEKDEFLVSRLLAERKVGRGKKRRTEYLVRWAAPYSDSMWDTWEPEDNVFNQGLIDQFERRKSEGRLDESAQFTEEEQRDGGDGGDGGGPPDDDDDDSPPGGGGGGGGGGDDDDDNQTVFDVSKLLVYDPNSTSIKTSLVLILKSLKRPLPTWTVDVLEELVLTSLWRIECYRIKESELTTAALDELVDELMQLDTAKLDAEYGTLSAQPGPANAQVPTRTEFYDAKRIDTRQRVEQRARATRSSTRDERQRLLDLLKAIDAIKTMVAGLPRPARTDRPLAERVLDQYETDDSYWWRFFLSPTIRTHQQNGLVRYRDAETTTYLEWLRKKQFPDGPRPTERASDLLGSSFSGFIPVLKTPTNLPVEHTGNQLAYLPSRILYHTTHSQYARCPGRSTQELDDACVHTPRERHTRRGPYRLHARAANREQHQRFQSCIPRASRRLWPAPPKRRPQPLLSTGVLLLDGAQGGHRPRHRTHLSRHHDDWRGCKLRVVESGRKHGLQLLPRYRQPAHEPVPAARRRAGAR